MGGRSRGEAADLARAAERFRAWRRVRQPGARIPESLWALAVRLVEKYGVSRTSSALGLDYYSLKKRAAAAESGSRSAAPAFVELPASSLVAGRECVIEMEDGAGATMRLHLKGYEASEVAAVGRRFWKVS
jgi:hypothetical protein